MPIPQSSTRREPTSWKNRRAQWCYTNSRRAFGKPQRRKLAVAFESSGFLLVSGAITLRPRARHDCEDCLAFCGLTEEEGLAIAEHEHTPEIAAASFAEYLTNQEHGTEKIRDMIVDDIRAAQAPNELPLGIFKSAPAQSPSPGLAEKYLSNFPVSSQ
jgi:hypothetical protein